MNHSIKGVTYKVDPNNIIVEANVDGKYLVIFKDLISTIDSSVFKGLNFYPLFNEKTLTVKTDESIYKYSPEDQSLEMVSIKGMFVEFENRPSNRLNDADKKSFDGLGLDFKLSFKSLSFKGFNVDFLLKKGKERIYIDCMKDLLEKNSSINYTAEDLKYEYSIYKNQRKITFIIDINKLSGTQELLPEIFVSLYNEKSEIPDFSKVLMKKASPLHLKMNCSVFKVNVKENDQLVGGGMSDKMNLSYFLKPNNTQSNFLFGMDWNIENMKIQIPCNKDIEKLFNMNELGIQFSMEHLSANFIKSYFDFVKKSMVFSTKMNEEKLKQQQMMMGMKIASEFIQSKPMLKFKISPLKHSWGEMNAAMEFQFCNLSAPPVGMAMAQFKNIKEILNNIKESLPEEISKKFLKLASQYIVIDEKGEGSIKFEIKEDHPGKFFLNGKSMK